MPDGPTLGGIPRTPSSEERIRWRPVGPGGHLYQRIVAQIERLIESNRLRPGDRLPPERELAALLRVSRPSLREAVKTLEAQGRLAVRHGQGVFVREPDLGADEFRAALASREVGLRELFAMREVLEVPAAGWAAESAGERDLSELAEALQALDRAARASPPDYERCRQLDSAFHMRIAEAAGNRFLAQTMEVLQEMLAQSMETTLSIPGRLARSRRDHAAIYQAIVSGDSGAARQAMRRHLKQVAAAALARLEAERARP
jgi:GntR family transcriptional repressor for pyruvate dehydrogenase complex